MKITALTSYTPYPSRKIRRICACTSQETSKIQRPIRRSTNTYDEPIDNLDKMEDEVGNPSPQSTPQVLPSFDEYIPPVTYPEEVEETLGFPMEVEPLDHTKLEDLGLNTCSHDLFLISREVPSFDEQKPQPQPLPIYPSLDESLGEERGLDPPTKPHSLDILMEYLACYECGGTDHYKSTCPRLNQAPGQGGNHQNQALAIEGGLGRGNNGNLVRGRAFMMGAEEARQDPNIVKGMFSLNNQYATMLFDSSADYSFVSKTFMPLLDIKPSSLGFSYEIKIASGKLVEINKVIRGCKLEIEGHTFDIDLIPFGHGSFDLIIGMDWLSRHRAEIVCHERVVRIPLPHGEMLRVYREQPDEKVKRLMSAKKEVPKLGDIAIVQNFSEVFLDDLLGLPPFRKVKFRIDLIPGAMPVVKSPYRLAPTEIEELSNQLKELQDKGFIRPSSSPWGAP
ncbi:putative reverse transcriptase domain-containing protein, partial [Tanacetum coccineum]